MISFHCIYTDVYNTEIIGVSPGLTSCLLSILVLLYYLFISIEI